MTQRIAKAIALAFLSVVTIGAPAAAGATQYPYTLIDPGTFGGPSSSR